MNIKRFSKLNEILQEGGYKVDVNTGSIYSLHTFKELAHTYDVRNGYKRTVLWCRATSTQHTYNTGEIIAFVGGMFNDINIMQLGEYNVYYFDKKDVNINTICVRDKRSIYNDNSLYQKLFTGLNGMLLNTRRFHNKLITKVDDPRVVTILRVAHLAYLKGNKVNTKTITAIVNKMGYRTTKNEAFRGQSVHHLIKAVYKRLFINGMYDECTILEKTITKIDGALLFHE